MQALVDLLNALPMGLKLSIAGIVIGIGAAYAHETRYMTVGDYTKSYVLNLKAEIRAIKLDLSQDDLSPEVIDMLEEQLEVLLDELCYEVPNDPYCKSREAHQ